MKKVLLLGANGQLGRDIQYVFSSLPEYQLIKIYRHNLDIEYDDIDAFLQKMDFDILINCTAYHKTDECEDFPIKAYHINSLAVLKLAQFCQHHKKKLFHISTDYVFDGTKAFPYTEEDCPNPLNVYGNSKLSGEHFIKSTHDQYFIFRVSSLFGVAGASGKGGNFIETMIQLGKQRKKLTVIDDQMMSPTATLEIAKAIFTFIDNDIESYGIYHCSGSGECSWYEFAREIFSELRMEVDLTPISHTSYQSKAKRPAYSVLDNSKLSHFYQLKSWRESVVDYLRFKGYKT